LIDDHNPYFEVTLLFDPEYLTNGTVTMVKKVWEYNFIYSLQHNAYTNVPVTGQTDTTRRHTR